MDKKSIILTLFAGEYEGVGMKPPTTKKYIESLHNMNTLHQTMELLLTSDDQKVFEDYLLATQENYSELSSQYFKEGFSLAVKLILEAIEEN